MNSRVESPHILTTTGRLRFGLGRRARWTRSRVRNSWTKWTEARQSAHDVIRCARLSAISIVIPLSLRPPHHTNQQCNSTGISSRNVIKPPRTYLLKNLYNGGGYAGVIRFNIAASRILTIRKVVLSGY